MDDINNLNDFVPDVHFELIPINQLVSSQKYQRALSTGHIHKTAEDFDLRQINPVKVSRRNGINYVWDGQHTVETIALVSNSRETPIWCMIYDDMDYETEADTFAHQQTHVKYLTPYDVFNGNIEAGNNTQVMILKLVQSYGLGIAPTRAPNSICAVKSLEYINDKYGYHTLDRTLRLIIGTWEGEMNSLSANMLKGVAFLIHIFGDKLREDIFRAKVGKYSAREISRTAKDRRNGSRGFAEAMLIAYNARMRNPLRMGDLYEKSKRNPIPHDSILENEEERENLTPVDARAQYDDSDESELPEFELLEDAAAMNQSRTDAEQDGDDAILSDQDEDLDFATLQVMGIAADAVNTMAVGSSRS